MGWGFESPLPHNFREVVQLARTPVLGTGGRRFESCLPDKWRSGRVVYSSALEKHRSSKAGRRFESGLLRNLIVVERDTSRMGFV